MEPKSFTDQVNCFKDSELDVFFPNAEASIVTTNTCGDESLFSVGNRQICLTRPAMCAFLVLAFWSGEWFCLWKEEVPKAQYCLRMSHGKDKETRPLCLFRDQIDWNFQRTHATRRIYKMIMARYRIDSSWISFQILPPCQDFYRILLSKCARGKTEYTLYPL